MHWLRSDRVCVGMVWYGMVWISCIVWTAKSFVEGMVMLVLRLGWADLVLICNITYVANYNAMAITSLEIPVISPGHESR